MGGEESQGGARVLHDDVRRGRCAAHGVRGDRRDRAAAECFLDVFVAVETLARERHEQVARVHRAAIGGDAGEREVRAEEPSPDRAGGFLEIHHRRLRQVRLAVHFAPPSHSASAARAISPSLNGWRTPAISW